MILVIHTSPVCTPRRKEQVDGAEQKAGDAEDQPDLPDVADELLGARVRLENSEEGRLEPQHERHGGPDHVQYDLAPQVVADLDVLFELMGRVVDLVVPLGLEEEVPRLARDHGDEPGDERRGDRVREQQDVGDEEADCTDEVQRLVDAAVVVVPMIIPALGLQLFPKTLHSDSSKRVLR